MNDIIRLDDQTIQKIAAGEVIERPGSIVKELVENSVDAHSSEITVEIMNGGIDGITVIDNGIGIRRESIPVAFERYATSKIRNFSDLSVIGTLGFRGEALASVAAVSKIHLLTKHESEDIGTQCLILDSKVTDVRYVAMNHGTTLKITDLFSNIPVRKKFLRSPQAEGNFITNIMYQLALGSYDISFKYMRDNSLVFRTSSDDTLEKAALHVLGKDFSDSSIKIDGQSGELKAFGLISNNNYFRGNRSFQYLYVNKRSVHNIDVIESIEKAYKNIIPVGKYPAFVLFIDIPQEKIDVNVHPNKQTIKFEFKNDLLLWIENILRESLTTNMRSGRITEKEDKSAPQQFYNWEKTDKYQDILSKYRKSIQPIPSKQEIVQNEFKVSEPVITVSTHEIIEDKAERASKDPNEDFNQILQGKRVGYLLNRYILMQIDDKRIAIIHQHRAHERILFERMLNLKEKEDTDQQLLLEPIVIKINSLEFDRYLNAREDIKKLGLDIDVFGENTLILRSIPVILGKLNLSEFIIELLDEYPDNKEYAWFAKKASFKAVNRSVALKDEEIRTLIADLSNCETPYVSPFGKRIINVIDDKYLDKTFER